MTQFTNKQLFYINSFFRQSGTSSDFIFEVDLNPLIEYDKITILDASIPKSNYAIESGKNTFTVTEHTGTKTITVPAGNYSRRGFKNVLEPLLNSNSGGYIYNISYPNIISTVDTGKFTFNVIGGISQPIFDFTTYLYDHLGFYPNTSHTFTDGSLEAPNVMNFRSRDTFFILSDIVQNRNNNILAHVISNQSADFEHVHFKNQAPYEYSKDFSRTKSNTYSFQITDEAYNIIDLNGIDCFFTLLVYKENNIDNLIKGYIKYKTMLDK